MIMGGIYLAQRSKICWILSQTIFCGSEALTRDRMPCGRGKGAGSCTIGGLICHWSLSCFLSAPLSLVALLSLPHLGLVVAEKGLGLVVVDCQPLLEQLGVVVGALYKGLTSDVVHARHLGRVELGVVRAARGLVDETVGEV